MTEEHTDPNAIQKFITPLHKRFLGPNQWYLIPTFMVLFTGFITLTIIDNHVLESTPLSTQSILQGLCFIAWLTLCNGLIQHWMHPALEGLELKPDRLVLHRFHFKCPIFNDDISRVETDPRGYLRITFAHQVYRTKWMAIPVEYLERIHSHIKIHHPPEPPALCLATNTRLISLCFFTSFAMYPIIIMAPFFMEEVIPDFNLLRRILWVGFWLILGVGIFVFIYCYSYQRFNLICAYPDRVHLYMREAFGASLPWDMITTIRIVPFGMVIQLDDYDPKAYSELKNKRQLFLPYFFRHQAEQLVEYHEALKQSPTASP